MTISMADMFPPVSRIKSRALNITGTGNAQEAIALVAGHALYVYALHWTLASQGTVKWLNGETALTGDVEYTTDGGPVLYYWPWIFTPYKTAVGAAFNVNVESGDVMDGILGYVESPIA